MPYFGLIGTILALFSWLVSNGFEKRADNLASGVAIAYSKEQGNRQFNLMLMHLNNLEKSEHSVSAKLDAIRPPVSTILDDRVLSFFHYTTSASTTGVPWDDLAAAEEQSEQLQTYIDNFSPPSCASTIVADSTVTQCVEKHLLAAPADFTAMVDLTQVRGLESSIPRGTCLASRSAAARLRFEILNAVASSVSGGFTSYQARYNLDGIALSNDLKNLAKVVKASPAYHAVGDVMRDCIDDRLTTNIQDVERLSQEALDYANDVSLPNARWNATMASWIAGILFFFSAILGVLGKYDDIRSKRVDAD